MLKTDKISLIRLMRNFSFMTRPVVKQVAQFYVLLKTKAQPKNVNRLITKSQLFRVNKNKKGIRKKILIMLEILEIEQIRDYHNG